MIEARQLSKRYGEKTAVDGLDFVVRPGAVTGFLGPNGAGKSTTMRMIVGLDAPTSGSVSVNGRRYAQHCAPLQEVGALLEAKSIHPGRSAFDHLMALAYTHGISRRRVKEMIELTGLESVADKRAGTFSLGMGQRLGIAAALLADPATVMLDEPVNGLDPEGVLWIRNLLTGLAAEGRTVFVSSHLMTEMALVADHLIIVGRGRLLADTTVQDLVRQAGGDSVKVLTADPARLREVLAGPGVEISGSAGSEELQVTGISPRSIGLAAAQHGIALFELTAMAVSLEQAFMDLTRDTVEYHSSTTGIQTPGRVVDAEQRTAAAPPTVPVPGSATPAADAASVAGDDPRPIDVITAAVPGPEAPDGNGVYGLVTDRDEVPLAGVAVTVFNTHGTQHTATSDRYGYYQVTVPGAGQYMLVARSDGRVPAAEWVALPGWPVRRDLRVEGSLTLSGEVRSVS
jgi:ABC-2 type transport system ATP-binding protein